MTVDVSASAQTLNISDASLGNAANNEEIQALPSETRNVPDLLSLQPGCFICHRRLPYSRSGSVNGGRSDQGNVTNDGVGRQRSGWEVWPSPWVLRQTQDSIEEFRVTTGGYQCRRRAVVGRTDQAMVTKSGTNRFHGAAVRVSSSHVYGSRMTGSTSRQRPTAARRTCRAS